MNEYNLHYNKINELILLKAKNEKYRHLRSSN